MGHLGLEPRTSVLSGLRSRNSFETRQKSPEDLSLSDLPIVTDLESLAQGYILNCRCEGKSTTTVEGYAKTIERFIWYCRDNGMSIQPNRITVAQIRSFLCYLASEPNRWDSQPLVARNPAQSSTVNRYYRQLRTFFNWLHHEQLIAVNPISSLRAPKVEKKVVQALSKTEINILLKACSDSNRIDVRNKAILSVFIDTGVRMNELLCMKIDDLDTITGSIVVRQGKGKKQRIVRVGSKAQKALWRYLTLYRGQRPGYLFLDRSGKQLTKNAIRLMIERLSAKTGIQGLHAHRLRHTFAIYFLRAGGDVFSLQYLLGHSTLQMTQRYLQSLNADDARKTHEHIDFELAHPKPPMGSSPNYRSTNG
jgi:site-specific recombinase XerD